MDETRHSPEPWRSDEHSDIRDASGHLCAEAYAGLDVSIILDATLDSKARAVERANARRIVACVNACAGIPSAALEAGHLAKALDAARDLFPWGPEHRTALISGEAVERLHAALRALGRMP